MVALLGMRMEGKKEQVYKQSISFFCVMMGEPCIPTKNHLYHSGVLSTCELWFNSSEIKLLPLGPDYRG